MLEARDSAIAGALAAMAGLETPASATEPVVAGPTASEAGTFRGVEAGTAMPLEEEREDTTDRERAAAATAAPLALDLEGAEASVAAVAVAAAVAADEDRWQDWRT